MLRRCSVALTLAVTMSTAMVAGCSSTPSQQSTGQAIDDGVITAKVKAKLIEDPVTKAHEIKVETFKGIVQLSGFVETTQARSRALQVAREVDGVKQVKDAMEIRKTIG